MIRTNLLSRLAIIFSQRNKRYINCCFVIPEQLKKQSNKCVIFTPSFRFLKIKRKKCWKCEEDVQNSDLFCSKCKFIQKPSDTKNYFNVFNLEQNFDVNIKKLRDSYRKMQSLLHPDKFSIKYFFLFDSCNCLY